MRMGSKGGLSARSSWSAVKKKLLDADPHGDFSEVTHGKPRTPRKTAKKAGGEEAAAPTPEGHDGAVGDDGPVTPTLKADAEANAGMDTPGAPTIPAKKRARKSKAEREAEAAANNDDAGDDAAEKPVKKRARKTPVKKAAAGNATGDKVATGNAGGNGSLTVMGPPLLPLPPAGSKPAKSAYAATVEEVEDEEFKAAPGVSGCAGA
ncbi:hypothetical protein HRR80_008486 [Exophiala dermatitidis]|nr:hypothetical protein HRR76_000613 [Exophiala dermatitidis]KAJ4553934.1 hypothetical protein HRR77_002303 [Exophiala dermatitidis]KAJ4578263.1 hypothetical protein HRR79_001575 [Exophiala dermatitidis]KAJ4585277.1 hypothetical protein HRR82_002357 [Exophiala dermatitidis]KAJ4614638.1 hypothetical protein HRR85_003428 [Exophiala dermatitidis]